MHSRKSADNTTKPQSPKEHYIPPQLSNDETEIFGQEIGTGVNFGKYAKIPVKVTGNNVSKALSTFDDCDLSPLLIQNIRKSKYTHLTPIQQHAIPNILNGRDLMGCAQTGSGKTAAFLMPMIQILLSDNRPTNAGRPHVVIVTPTRELAIQVGI